MQGDSYASTSDLFDLRNEYVADAALGLDETRRAGIGLQLASQPQHLHVDATVEHIFVYAGGLQEVFASERTLRRVEKGDQERVFSFRQRNRRPIWIGQSSRVPIYLPAGKSKATQSKK